MTVSRRKLLLAGGAAGMALAAPAHSADAAVQDAGQLPPAERQRHENHMRLAIAEAKKNPQWPFGAVIVHETSGQVLAAGVNDGGHNPTLHGEIAALNDYVSRHGNTRWPETTLYTTGEPCPMCMSAIAWAGIPRVVWATSIAGLSRAGIGQIGIGAATVAAAADFYRPEKLVGGVLAAQTDLLFQQRPK